MLADLGQLFGGLGLFLAGIWLLTDNLRAQATRRIRRVALNWLPNRFVAYGWGALFGSILQSMSALTFITASMSRANLIPRERAFALVLGGNVGQGLLVLFVALDFHTAAFFVLGAFGALMFVVREGRQRRLAAAAFAGALLIVSLGLIKSAAASLAEQGLFDELLRLSGSSLWLLFLGGVLLSFLALSSGAAIVFALGLVSVGVINDEQAMMYVYGALVGPAIMGLALSWKLASVARQLAMFNILYNIVLAAMLVPLLYVENWTGIPLIKTLVLAIPLEQPISALLLTIDAVAALPFILLLPLVTQLCSRWWPPSYEESLSQTVYIQQRGYGDADTALELAALEQRRVISIFPSYLDAVRERRGVDPLSSSVRQLLGEINDFLTDVRQNFPSRRYVEDINGALTRQRYVEWLEERFSELCEDLNNLPHDESTVQLRDLLIEGLDNMVVAILDGLSNEDPEQQSMILELTSGRDEALRRVRRRVFSNDTGLSDTAQTGILKATNTAAEIFSLLHRMAQQMQPATEPDVMPNARGESVDC